MSELREKYTEWSAIGEQMAVRARWGAAIQGTLLMILAATLLISGSSVMMAACVVSVVLGALGLTLVGRGAAIENRYRGSTISVLVISLIVSLLITIQFGLLLFVLVFRGATDRGVHPVTVLLLAMEFLIGASGYFTTWFCIQTLRHWPSAVGTSFPVELARPAEGAKDAAAQGQAAD